MFSRLKLILLILLLLPLVLSAHQRSESYSKFNIELQPESYKVEAVFTVQLGVLSRMDRPLTVDWKEILKSEILNGISVGGDCLSLKKPEILSSRSTGYFRLSWSELCQGQFYNVRNNIFFDDDPSHSHISSIILNGSFLPEKLFTNQSRVWNIKELTNPNRNESSSFFDYFILGLKHISSGFDHIAFLIGILLPFVREPDKHGSIIFGAVLSAFSHKSTSFVESLIGYSILLVALEYIARKTDQVLTYTKILVLIFVAFIFFYIVFGQDSYLIGLIGLGIFSISYLLLISRVQKFNLSIAVTSLFGLVHGFGFSGSLSEVGLPEGRIFQALLGFNLGVEAGQILIVCSLVALAFLGRGIRSDYKESAKILLASLLLSLGSFWFVERIF